MKEQFSFYLAKNNKNFNGNVLVICYKATSQEIKENGLTGDNILIFLKSSKLDDLVNKKDINYFLELKDMFKNKKVYLRVQCECLLGMFGDSHCDCEEQKNKYINYISQKEGIFVHLPQEGQGWGLHYKLRELELQLSGRITDGKYVGVKNRDDAQFSLLGNQKFKDLRNYKILKDIFQELSIFDCNFIILTESDIKVNQLSKLGFNTIKYSEELNNEINEDNMSEYLVKILNCTHEYGPETIREILALIKNRKYNERSLLTLVNIINKIKQDKKYKLNDDIKKEFIDVYNDIICGEEKQYIINNINKIKIQNNFSCKVSPFIFKTIKNYYGKNIFDRISLEKLYYFKHKTTDETVRIRTSRILRVNNITSIFFEGQQHAEQRNFNKEKNRILQSEITISKLRSFFENSDYDYIKRVEMITFISENVLPGISIFVKRLPNIENRVMDIFGEKKTINEFVNNIFLINSEILLNSITDGELEDENFSKYNLRFADINSIIEEELNIYDLISREE